MTDNLNGPSGPTIRKRVRPPVEAGQHGTSASYEVGYGKPPRAHRFKLGQSGNPKGRPKGARGINALTRALLEKKVEMRIGGKTRKVMAIEAITMKLLELASKGNPRAIDQCFKLYGRLRIEDPVQEGLSSTTDTEADQAILDSFIDEIVAKRTAPKQTHKGDNT